MAKRHWLLALLCMCVALEKGWSLDASFDSPNVVKVDKTTLLKREIEEAVPDDIVTLVGNEENTILERQARKALRGVAKVQPSGVEVIDGETTIIIIRDG